MVGYGNGCMSCFLCRLRNIGYTAGTVEQAVFAVQMKMYKFGHIHTSLISIHGFRWFELNYR